jgi:lipopolysaccharide transport system permease protein/teichoic acid transport system permease protein
MAKQEVAKKYVGSMMGFLWTFIHPLVLVLVLWVVFGFGFRVKPVEDVPFVVWLSAGMCSWFVFSEILSESANSVVANANLIKKTLFPSQILPIVKIASAFIAHSVFILVLLGLILLNRLPPHIINLQFIYYLFCLSILSLGLGWAVSALNVFIRDVGQIVSVILQIGFWATPILWNIELMPEKIQFLFKLNPLFYIIRGYRDSFVYFVPFWHHPLQTVYFWVVASCVFITGALIFQKLKPQFPDVL